jgi:hypothetical protein
MGGVLVDAYRMFSHALANFARMFLLFMFTFGKNVDVGLSEILRVDVGYGS